VIKNLESNSFYYKEVKKKAKELSEKHGIEFNIIF